MTEKEWLWTIWLLNICLAAIYFFYRGVIKKEYRKAFLMFLFMALVPVVGILYMVVSEGINELIFRKRDGLFKEDELSFNKKRTRMIIDDDIEKEIDCVPIEEALRLSDAENRRRTFLEALKRPDAEDYMKGIHRVMGQEDYEIVHYAASYITDSIARFKTDEGKLRSLSENAENPETIMLYVRYCMNFLEKKVLGDFEQNMYLIMLEKHMERLYTLEPQKVNGEMISELLEIMKGFPMEENEEKWMNRGKALAETDLAAAKEVLKYYFEKENKEKFEETLEQIKESALVLDSEILEWIRFYSGKAKGDGKL